VKHTAGRNAEDDWRRGCYGGDAVAYPKGNAAAFDGNTAAYSGKCPCMADTRPYFQNGVRVGVNDHGEIMEQDVQ